MLDDEEDEGERIQLENMQKKTNYSQETSSKH